MSQESVLAEVAMERKYQDAKWGGPEKDDKLMEEEWVMLIVRHMGLGCRENTHVSADTRDRARYRKQLVRVAALAVAAVESFDRQHPPKKVFDTRHRGSGV